MTAIPKLSAGRTRSTTFRWYYLTAAFSSFSESLHMLEIPVSVLLFWIGYNKSKSLSLGAALLLLVVAPEF
jgi:ABC-type transport system involved in cytochrome bd biosynthesis fused ATPase/permease subunit